jgi:hypothetical protein
LVAVLSSIKFTPGITALDGSRTVPLTVPALVCACAGTARIIAPRSVRMDLMEFS